MFYESFRINKTVWSTKCIILKPANKYEIIWQCHNIKNILINDFQLHPFLYPVKVLLTFLLEPKVTSC